MYVPPKYRITDEAVIDAFIRANAFATLVTAGQGGLMATHIPVELTRGADGARLLRGHVSKANPQWLAFGDEADAMIVFAGAHAYIDPSWYDHENVPTWNYQAVHAYGPLRLLSDKTDELGAVRELGKRYGFNVDAMTEQVRKAELKGIVTFEMRVTRLDVAFKLSQNRNDGDHARIITELEARGDDHSRAVAKAMKEHR